MSKISIVYVADSEETMRRFAISLTLIMFALVSPVLAQDNPVITLENAAQLEPIVTLEGHEGGVNSVAFSPDGTLLASGGTDTVVRLWNPTTGELTNELSGHTAPVFAVAFNSDGTLLATTGQDFSVPIWDVNSGEQIDNASNLTDLGIMIIGLAASGDRPGYTAAFYALTWVSEFIEGEEETPLAAGDVEATSLVPRDTFFVGDPTIYSLAVASDGSIVEGTSEGIRLFFSGINQGADLTGVSDSIHDVEFSADGTLLASAGADNTVILWDVSDRDSVEAVAVLEGHEGDVTSISFSPDGALLVSASQDGMLRVWDVASHNEIATLSTLQTTEVYTVAFSPDGTRIASAGNDGAITLWGISS
ncbi:MAG: WD40 repeat domain-containing protein [Chloroflexi bacterium]|nr:WD40 repeat domain-containing protein [Chloroflexota bacterium]